MLYFCPSFFAPLMSLLPRKGKIPSVILLAGLAADPAVSLAFEPYYRHHAE